MIKYVVGLCIGIVLSVAAMIYSEDQHILALLGGIIMGYSGINIVIKRSR